MSNVDDAVAPVPCRDGIHGRGNGTASCPLMAGVGGPSCAALVDAGARVVGCWTERLLNVLAAVLRGPLDRPTLGVQDPAARLGAKTWQGTRRSEGQVCRGG